MIAIEILFWYWWVIAVFLLGVEMLSAGFFFLWMSVSAFITGLLLLLFPMIVEIQLFIFSILSVGSVVAWKRYMRSHPIKSDQPHLNQRNDQYIGRVFTLVTDIDGGDGKIKINRSHWKVEGEDCPVGTRVKIVSVNGNFFNVKPVD
ncbi:MAG: NfeD family protein [Methylococcales bacterium]|nr:NfeD family protein [Methylococcales bacterium]